MLLNLLIEAEGGGLHDAVLEELGGVAPPQTDDDGDDDDEHDEVGDEDGELVVLVGEPRGQADGDGGAVVAVGVAVLFVVLARRVVSEDVVGLGDLDELVGALGRRALVRVVNERHLPVRLLDRGGLRALLDVEDLERVEGVHLLRLHRREPHQQRDEDDPGRHEANPSPSNQLGGHLLPPHPIKPLDLLLARAQLARPVLLQPPLHGREEGVRDRDDDHDHHRHEEPVESNIVEHLERHRL
mmetsp:Transcript_27875/g.60001  ORF Transcript_27875/g.60001 Transcript_27875/m.60001 type:complete len:242 (+) Transcript_27875:843-1568(+)